MSSAFEEKVFILPTRENCASMPRQSNQTAIDQHQTSFSGMLGPTLPSTRPDTPSVGAQTRPLPPLETLHLCGMNAC